MPWVVEVESGAEVALLESPYHPRCVLSPQVWELLVREEPGVKQMLRLAAIDGRSTSVYLSSPS